MTKLNQVIAVASTKKSAAKSEMERAYHAFQKPGLFTGLHKVYDPKDEGGEELPEESKRIELKVTDIINSLQKSWSEMVDVVVTNDVGNSEAKADVIVGGTTLLTQVPVTSLIFLEKQLTDLNSLVSSIPTLSEAQEWVRDDGAEIYRSSTVKTNRTKKVQKALVLYPHSPEHPAQTTLITEDENVGTWSTTALSSALTNQQVKAVKERVSALKDAVVKAREEANSITVTNQTVGSTAFKFVFEPIL